MSGPAWTEGTGAGNTVIMYKDDQYPTSVSDGAEAYIGNGVSATVENLDCGSSYYFRAWSSTSDGGITQRSDNYSEAIISTLACGGGRTCAPPQVFIDSLVVNQGAEYTQTREVELSLKADNVLHMSVCNDNLFYGSCVLEPYQESKSWTLTEGDGEKTVYSMFVSDCGANSSHVFDTIVLESCSNLSSSGVMSTDIAPGAAIGAAPFEVATPPSFTLFIICTRKNCSLSILPSSSATADFSSFTSCSIFAKYFHLNLDIELN